MNVYDCSSNCFSLLNSFLFSHLDDMQKLQQRDSHLDELMLAVSKRAVFDYY